MLASEELCTGCAACHDQCNFSAIQMKYNHEGFLYPVIDEQKCTCCKRCEHVCPVINKSKAEFTGNYCLKAYMGWNKDQKQRRKSTSGGLFPVFADDVLNRKGIVIGAAFDQSMYLSHLAIEDKDEISKLMGSKYLQSDTGGIFKKTQRILNEGRTVLFTGVPCQVKGLLSYLNGSYENLYTCELFCHGVPSPKIFSDLVNYLEKAKYQMTDFQFRDKLLGWETPNIKVVYKSRMPKYQLYKCNAYVSWFGKHLSVRRSCFNCYCRELPRQADISIGDFWGIKQIKPDIHTTHGVSAMLINSQKGEQMVEKCAGRLFLSPCDYRDILKENAYLLNNYILPADRRDFFEIWNAFGIHGLIKKYPGFGFWRRTLMKLTGFWKIYETK